MADFRTHPSRSPCLYPGAIGEGVRGERDQEFAFHNRLQVHFCTGIALLIIVYAIGKAANRLMWFR